jgi:hypothetical protein
MEQIEGLRKRTQPIPMRPYKMPENHKITGRFGNSWVEDVLIVTVICAGCYVFSDIIVSAFCETDYFKNWFEADGDTFKNKEVDRIFRIIFEEEW